MSETARFGLPLLMPAQAQKHVTVNEALLRLDAVSQLVLVSRTRADPPAVELEGDCYAVPQGATGDWTGRDGEIALFTNGGWQFLVPKSGWRAWIEDEGVLAIHDGDWTMHSGTGASAPSGGPVHRTITIDHPLAAGPASVTEPVLPAGAVVYGVTGRVLDTIGGATAFSLGVPESAGRYGSGIGVDAGSWLRGLTSSPLVYWAETSLQVTAEGGEFDGTGSLRLAVYIAELPLPE